MSTEQPRVPAIPGVARWRVTNEAITAAAEAIDAEFRDADGQSKPRWARDLAIAALEAAREQSAATYEPAGEEKTPAAPPAPVAASLDPCCPRCGTMVPELLMRQGEPLCPGCWDAAEATPSLGQILHEARCAGGEGRPRPWPPESWEDRDPRLKALDEAMASAVAAAERRRIRELADRTGAACTGDEGTSHFFSALLEERGPDSG